jgi:DNA-binding NarL/FixJ family response regulator
LDGDPLQAPRRATEALLEGATGAGVVVGVDDAHLLDELSASVVHQLVLHQRATVVVTVRSGEPAPDAIISLWKDGYLDRLEVQPLSAPETTELVEAALGGLVDGAALARLWTLTQGNALFLRQVVDDEREAGRLREKAGAWRWEGHPVVSPVLTELVEARMGQLPEPLSEVVDLLALNEPLGVGMLAGIAGAETLEAAEARGLVTVERDGQRLQARLAHPLLGEVRRARLGALRARRLRGRLAMSIAATGSRRSQDTLLRAVLTLDSDLAHDPALFTAAARDAMLMLDLPLGVRLAHAAVTAGGGLETGLTLAWALAGLSRGFEADSVLAELAASARTDEQRTRVAIPRAGNLFFTMREPAAAETLLADILAIVTDQSCRDQLTAMQAAFDGLLGRPDRALRSGRIALAAENLSDQAVMAAAYGLVTSLGSLGRADELGPIVARGHAAAHRRFEAAFMRFGLVDLHLAALWPAGYLHEAEQIARDCGRNFDMMPEPLRLYGVGILGVGALYRGRVRTSVRLLRQAFAGLAPFETTGFALACLLRLTRALAVAGDAPAARAMLTVLEEQEHPAFVCRQPEMRLARAWVSAAECAVTEAITAAREAAGIAASRGQPAQELLALHTAVCFGDHTGTIRLADLATQVDGPRAPAAAAHATALAADDGNGLLAVSEALEALGDALAAADAAAQAAAAHMRAGRRTAAQLASTRAQRLATACEGARTPALSAALRPRPLTEREREIVSLAARGLSNQQIADRLVVSVRTIEGHLYRAGAKLGTGDRTAFAALLDIT